ncbi:hypothetical protein DYB31_010105 [Aphanomyces astaci]|uniref:SCP domain-containing protein n=1 Tax=Aphanomyces astaci TaxID=112090 RepID=A0A397F7N6_APHAT|nr:hypothetical protein DYB31_010105 [Aphanomyces astaci]
MATHDPQSTTSVDAFRNSAMVIMEESDAKDTNAYIVAFQRRRKMRIVAIATGALLVLGVAAAVVVATDSTADNASTSSGRDRLPLNAAGGNNGGGSQSPSTTTVDDTFVGGPEIYFTHTTLSPGSPSNVHGGSTTSSGKHSDVDGGSTASSNHGKNPAGYGLGPVTWNDDLAKKMQAWADSCPQKTGGGHGGPPGNQNLASFIVCGNNCMHEPGPAQTWWDSEEELWDYDANKSRDGNWMTTGHFQNSLDPGVNEIACGWSTCFNPIANQNDSLVWCNYIGGTNGRIPRPIITKAEIKARIIK